MTESDHEFLGFVASIVVGGLAAIVAPAVVHDPVLGEGLGFLAMSAAVFPFAQRTWASKLTPFEYWRTAAFATAAGAALRIIVG